MAINIDKIAAVTYDSLIKELGDGCVDGTCGMMCLQENRYSFIPSSLINS